MFVSFGERLKCLRIQKHYLIKNLYFMSPELRNKAKDFIVFLELEITELEKEIKNYNKRKNKQLSIYDEEIEVLQ